MDESRGLLKVNENPVQTVVEGLRGSQEKYAYVLTVKRKKGK